MRPMYRLSAAQVRNCPVGKHSDGGGLWLHRREDGGAQWVLRVTVGGGSVLQLLPFASSQCYDAAIRGAGHREHVSAGRPI